MKNWIQILGLIAVRTVLDAQDVEKPRSMFSMLNHELFGAGVFDQGD